MSKRTRGILNELDTSESEGVGSDTSPSESSGDDDYVEASARSARREARKERYMKGGACKAYTLTSDLSRSFGEDEDPSTSGHREESC